MLYKYTNKFAKQNEGHKNMLLKYGCNTRTVTVTTSVQYGYYYNTNIKSNIY
jgi:hypothetical protein